MLAKWSAKQNRQRRLEHSPPARFWTSTALGRAVLAAELGAIRNYLSGQHARLLELAPLELPDLDFNADQSGNISLRAASSSWQTPLLASLETLPVCSRSVDVIIWRYLGLEWRVRRRLLADVVRALTPGGLMVTVTLNPLDPAVWRLGGLNNIGLQAAGGVNNIARALGMQMLDKSWYGPGFWRLRPLQVSLLQKRSLGGASQKVLHRSRRNVVRPAVALSGTAARDRLTNNG